MPIHSQAYTDPCQSIVNHITIDCQSDYNSVPIRFQSKATNFTPLGDHSIDNLIQYPDSMSNEVIQCQSTTNPGAIPSKSANPMQIWHVVPEPIQHKTDQPIKFQSTNPLPIHYISGNPITVNQSWLNPTSHNIQITEDTLIIHFSNQLATACQYGNNIYWHRLALNWQRSRQSTTAPYGHVAKTWWNKYYTDPTSSLRIPSFRMPIEHQQPIRDRSIANPANIRNLKPT